MKKLNKTILIFIIIGVLLFGYLGFRVYKDFFNTSKTKELDSLGLYGYTLTDNDSKSFKTEFETLRTVLNEEPVNYKEYAKSISKLFIIDLYTINNKMGSTDIGGTEYIYPDFVDNFKENMGRSLYKNVKTNIYDDRTQSLPEVSEVTIDNIEEFKYTYNKEEYDAYKVNASWTYVEDLGYQSKISLTIIKSNNRLYVVQGNE